MSLTISTDLSEEKVNERISEASYDDTLFLEAYSVGERDLKRLGEVLDAVSQHLVDNYTGDYF